MCAPRALKMEADSISRFNSTSTSRTLVNDESDIASSLLSPVSLIDRKLSSNPILQTADNKQWIDLDSISPKLLRELRKQYDTASGDDKNSISKRAAKIKAWTRQTKLGFDVRLRRKVRDHDEVTDFRLIRDPSFEIDAKPWTLQELPGNAVHEMPDTSVLPELPTDSSSQQDEAPMDLPTHEPLPRYVPRFEGDAASIRPQITIEPVELHNDAIGHRRSPSESSIVTTPEDGLVLGKPEAEPLSEKPTSSRTIQERQGETAQALEATLTQAKQEMKEEVMTLLTALKEELSRGSVCETPAAQKDFEGLRIAEMLQYETETDAEPPSPSAHRGKYSLPRAGSKLKRGITVRKPSMKSRPSDMRDEPVALARRQTLPKKMLPSAEAETVWTAVLKAQSKILGAEHPLTFQAKHAQSLSRVRQHRNCPASLLDALRQSETAAMQTLGKVHPLVETFCADLEMLESMIISHDNVASTTVAGDRSKSSISMHFENDDEDEDGDEDEDKLVEQMLERNYARPQSTEAERDEQEWSFRADGELPHITIRPEQNVSTRNTEIPHQIDALWNTQRSPHQPRNGALVLASFIVGATANSLRHVISWLELKYGPEPALEPGKVRVRWTCSCGAQLYDDFIERRQGAARELEAYLNRPSRPRSRGETHSSPSNSTGSSSFNGSFNSSAGVGSLSTQTSWSSHCPESQKSFSRDNKRTDTTSSLPQYTPFAPLTEPPWLLTCANEERSAPKVSHLDMSPHKITSDKELAKTLREHYFDVNRKWWKRLRLRGLTTIEFVQFECHQNRLADIRKCPDMPPHNKDDYTFEPSELVPPVGSQYLLHLFKHPEDYSNEMITYQRAPKKTGRLQLGVGWGIHLVEGVLAEKVWMLVNAAFGFTSVVFAVAWALGKNDIQGAFSIAQWVCMLAACVAAWVQACLN